MKSEKTAICNAFTKAATDYDSVATIQQQVAHDLASFIFNFISPQTPRTCIDLGCGTGFLSQSLLHLYPTLQLTVNDLSPAMIQKATACVVPRKKIETVEGDLETIQTDRTWDLVGSNFVWQWLENPRQALKSWSDRSTDLALSLPLEGSFQEWKELYSHLALPSRLRKLPTLEELHQWGQAMNLAHFEIQEKNYTQTFRSALDFARQLKGTGASLSPALISPSALRKVQKMNPSPFLVTWKVAFLACHSRSPRL